MIDSCTARGFPSTCEGANMSLRHLEKTLGMNRPTFQQYFIPLNSAFFINGPFDNALILAKLWKP